MANLAGLPPRAGFLIKLMLIKEYAINNVLLLVIAALILRSINFFVYARVISKVMLKNANQFQITTKQATKIRMTISIIFIISPMPLVYLLGHA